MYRALVPNMLHWRADMGDSDTPAALGAAFSMVGQFTNNPHSYNATADAGAVLPQWSEIESLYNCTRVDFVTIDFWMQNLTAAQQLVCAWLVTNSADPDSEPTTLDQLITLTKNRGNDYPKAFGLKYLMERTYHDKTGAHWRFTINMRKASGNSAGDFFNRAIKADVMYNRAYWDSQAIAQPPIREVNVKLLAKNPISGDNCTTYIRWTATYYCTSWDKIHANVLHAE